MKKTFFLSVKCPSPLTMPCRPTLRTTQLHNLSKHSPLNPL